jgi:choline dehydrogenase-like flavoprotein
MPTLNYKFLGKILNKERIGLGQLVMFYDQAKTNMDVGMCSLFTYRSLLLNKLIRETPLNFRDGRIIMQYLQSAFVIAGIHHPERPGPGKFIQLKKDSSSITGDILFSKYELSSDEDAEVKRRESGWKWTLRQLGCLPLKQIYPGHGSSIHYAGTLPFSAIEKELTLSAQGRLHKTKNVYVADASGFNYLPAKGLTLTIMANAHVTTLNALKS